MRREPAAMVLAAVGVALWVGLIVVPLVALYAAGPSPARTSAAPAASVPAEVTVRSFGIAAALAGGSVLLG